jgi:hypothetical protein
MSVHTDMNAQGESFPFPVAFICRQLDLNVIPCIAVCVSFLAGSNVEGFAPGGAAAREVARKLSSYRNILRVQPLSVVLRAFAFESLGVVHADAMEVLSRLQGRVNLAVLTNDDNIWLSVVRRISMAIA